MTVCAPSRASRKLRPGVVLGIGAVLAGVPGCDTGAGDVDAPADRLERGDPFGSLLSFNQRAVGALTSSAAPPSTSRFAPSSHFAGSDFAEHLRVGDGSAQSRRVTPVPPL